MPTSKVTSKFQVTIPKGVRERVGLEPGETVVVEAHGEDIIIRRFKRVRNPLKVLIGERPLFAKPIPIEELERRLESR